MVSLPAVQITREPSADKSITDASPTPPDAAGTNADCAQDPLERIESNPRRAVRYTVGIVAASANEIEGAIGARTSCPLSSIPDPRQPCANPNTRLDKKSGLAVESITPLQSEPGGPGSPGYMSNTFRRSRKFNPTAITRRYAFWIPMTGSAWDSVTKASSDPRCRGRTRADSREMTFSDLTSEGMKSTLSAARRNSFNDPLCSMPIDIICPCCALSRATRLRETLDSSVATLRRSPDIAVVCNAAEPA